MTYVHGCSMCCAQGQQDAVYAQLAQPLPPAPFAFDFLGQPVQAAYFRAFAAERLTRTMFYELVDRHIRAAIADAGWPADSLADTAILVGSSAYTLAACELAAQQGQPHSGMQTLHDLADHLSACYGHRQIYSFATACTSAAQALLQAHQLLCTGLIKRAVVVGVESFNLLTLAHFHSMGLLSEHYRPFAGNGFMLGEGIACLAVSAQKPHCTGLRLLSAVANTDVGGLTDVHADSLVAVMQQALQAAGVAVEAVRLIKAHAVGTAASDAAEAQAIAAVLGNGIPLACFKPYIGHTLGASAALETVLLQQCLQARRLPATVAVSAQDTPLSAGIYLSHAFGFGGSNVVMVWDWQDE